MQPEDDKIRINKFLARSGFGSRRGVEEAVLNGDVRVNGKIVKDLATHINPLTDEVKFKNKLAKKVEPRIFLFNKPEKVITTLSDPQSRASVGDFIKKLSIKVAPVGRLDYDVSGLLLLTNDGDYAHKLLHPSFEVIRTYIAQVEGQVELEKYTEGVKLEDGLAKAFNASFLRKEDKLYLKYFSDKSLGKPNTKSNTNFIKLEVKEGRHHFVKRFCAALGNPVVQLLRTGFADYKLNTLPPGKFKEVNFIEL